MVAAGAIAGLAGWMTPASLGERVNDRLVPALRDADERIVVAAFDERIELTPSYQPNYVPFRSGILLKNVAIAAERLGATAVVFVDFDSLAFEAGSGDADAVADSDAMQALAIVPLLEPTLGQVDLDGIGRVPLVDRYRVDPLAAHVAGIGLPLVDGADIGGDGDPIRGIVAVASVGELTPGAVVGPQLPSSSRSLVLGLAVRTVAGLPDATVADATSASISVGGVDVPLEHGWLRVRWSDALDDVHDDAVVSALDLAAGEIRPDLTGKVLLVGTTDAAERPWVVTPNGRLPEVLVHANAVNTLLQGEVVRAAPSWISVLGGASMMALVLLAARSRSRVLILVGLAVTAAWSLAAWASAASSWTLDPVGPVVAALLMVAFLSAVRQIANWQERRRLALLFRQYVPPDVADELIGSGRATAAAAGERLNVTSLFCDIRGFTPLAGSLEPSAIRELLDRYYEVMSAVIFEHEGTVLQYTGDEIFAVFGAPLIDVDHADHAMSAALAMIDALPRLHRSLARDGLPEVSMGIGLHSGPVVAAHVGSSVRRQYAVLGDSVIIASRLCGVATAGQVCYSSAVAAVSASALPGRLIGPIELKGVDQPVITYVIDPHDERPGTAAIVSSVESDTRSNAPGRLDRVGSTGE